MEQMLTRQQVSDALDGLGWRLVLSTLRASVAASSMGQAVEVIARAVAACGADADEHLIVDLRAERVVLSLQSFDLAAVTALDLDLAHRITSAVRELGLRTDAGIGAGVARSLQLLEIAIDALDIAAVRPFWKAVLGYTDEAGGGGPEDSLVDPLGQGPAVWFQQMDQPRPQRNRIHLDVSVPHDEAPQRIEAALSAGGRMMSADRAPAFWVLADVEGNEACVSTWQGRDV